MLFILISGSARWFASFSLSLFLSLVHSFLPSTHSLFQLFRFFNRVHSFSRTQSIPPKTTVFTNEKRDPISPSVLRRHLYIQSLHKNPNKAPSIPPTSIKMRVASAAVVASLAAGAIATEYKTVYVTEYTTVCPKATSLATGPGAGSGSGAQTTPAAAQVRLFHTF